MKNRKNAEAITRVRAHAREVLRFAEEKARTAKDWIELHFAVYGVHGKASELFPDEADRIAFGKTPEENKFGAILDKLPYPEASEAVRLDGLQEAIARSSNKNHRNTNNARRSH